MPNNRINPRTGKRIAWEEARAAEKAADPNEDLKRIEQHLELLRRQQKAQNSRDSLLEYTKFTMPDPEALNDATRSCYQPEKFHEIIAHDVEKLIAGELKNADGSTCNQVIFCMPPRHGKSCAHDTPVPTPEGWRLHGDLRPGDFVFDPDGVPTEVLAISPDVDEVVPVTLTNGEVIEVHPNHEWRVFDRGHGQWRVMETRDIAKRKLRSGPKGRGGRYVLQLPDVGAMQYPERDLPIHPYVLGAWLGDGSSASTRIAHDAKDTEVVDAIEALGHPKSGYFVQRETGVAYTSFSGPRPGVGSDMQKTLRAMGVLNNKHVPQIYLIASIEQRLELLAGLVDTDGYVDPKGRVVFCTCSEELRDGAFELAASLGFRPYVMIDEPRTSSSGIIGKRVTYKVGFQPNISIPVRIPRKAIRKTAVRRRIAIKHVGGVVRKPARSICVARLDGLYVVGRQHVATKNTELATKRLAAWVSGKFPRWDVAVASYSDTMAQDMGADTRAILTSKQHKQVFPKYKLRRGGTAKDNIQTDEGGRLVFVGRGGALTGRGMSVGLGDDIFKDHEEARSQTIRDAAWNWFTKVFMTRRMGPKIVMLTMTRWHSDDVIGRITDPENPHYNAIEAKKWKIIRLPAIAEEDDPLGREPGEALWPGRFDLDFLQSQQRLDPLGFEALYQQRPSLADGDMFKREDVRFYQPGELPTDLRIYCASDHAVATGQRNDFTVLLKAGVDREGNLYLIDCWWRKEKSDVVVEQMLNMGGRGDKRPLMWFAEKGHISKSIGPFLRKRMTETGAFFPLKEITPIGDKATRAQSIAGRVASGRVFLPKGATWTEKAINEMMAFPNGLHDDFVDTASLLGLQLQNQFGPGKKNNQKLVDQPKFGTLDWVKQADRWAELQRDRVSAGGF